MKFWQEKLPNFIYDINYEKLTENKEDQVKKLLKFCNLNWEEDCLNFNKKGPPIKTVSITQARKAIYKTSVNLHENGRALSVVPAEGRVFNQLMGQKYMTGLQTRARSQTPFFFAKLMARR